MFCIGPPSTIKKSWILSNVKELENYQYFVLINVYIVYNYLLCFEYHFLGLKAAIHDAKYKLHIYTHTEQP